MSNPNQSEPSESRASLVIRALFALPMFLVLTVIFWEVVLGAWLLSKWFYDQGWSWLGLSAKIVWIALGVLTVVVTVMGCAACLVGVFRAIRGKD
jgi:hypothetical protein